jgi:hypothetical protein
MIPTVSSMLSVAINWCAFVKRSTGSCRRTIGVVEVCIIIFHQDITAVKMFCHKYFTHFCMQKKERKQENTVPQTDGRSNKENEKTRGRERERVEKNIQFSNTINPERRQFSTIKSRSNDIQSHKTLLLPKASLLSFFPQLSLSLSLSLFRNAKVFYRDINLFSDAPAC